MKIFDISIEIKNGMIVYPGDPVVEILPHKIIPTDSSNVSKITTGSHTGTHLDAKSHVFADGESIDEFPLEYFVGSCKVFDLSYLGAGELIKISDLENKDINVGDRILIKTSNSSRGFSEFYTDFVALSGDCAEFLANKKIKLFGIDYMSVKQKGSKDNRSHTELLKNNIAILETIDLSAISEGEYELICLPIKLHGLDGAPTRAVLIQR